LLRNCARDGLTVWSAVLGQLRGLLRVGFLPLLAVELVIFMKDQLLGGFYGAALFLIALIVQIWIACRISVVWQRWLVLAKPVVVGEVVPDRGLVGRYFRLELALYAILLVAICAASIFTVVAVGIALDDEGGADLRFLVLAVAVPLVFWSLLACRLLLVFPATAVGEVSFGFHASWKATTGWTLQILLAGWLTMSPLLLYGVILMLLPSGGVWAELIVIPLNTLSYLLATATVAGLGALYFARIVGPSIAGSRPQEA